MSRKGTSWKTTVWLNFGDREVEIVRFISEKTGVSVDSLEVDPGIKDGETERSLQMKFLKNKSVKVKKMRYLFLKTYICTKIYLNDSNRNF